MEDVSSNESGEEPGGIRHLRRTMEEPRANPIDGGVECSEHDARDAIAQHLSGRARGPHVSSYPLHLPANAPSFPVFAFDRADASSYAPTDLTLVSAPSTYWWEKPSFVALMIALAAIPLLYPRFRRWSTCLAIWAATAWHWISPLPLAPAILRLPLGIDRQSRRRSAGRAARRLIGLEPAVKLIVMSIPAAHRGRVLWVAYEVHGRVPPTALFAVPFAYDFPFLFGFVNFALAMALALIAFACGCGLAVSTSSDPRGAVRADLAASSGWRTPLAGARSACSPSRPKLVRQHDQGRKSRPACRGSALHYLALAPPGPC